MAAAAAADSEQARFDQSSGISTPRPDPTVATTDALAAAVAALTQYIDGQLDVRDERLSGIDKATSLRLDTGLRLNDVTRAIEDNERLWQEKFASVEKQFLERDTRSERESRDRETAVNAAFAAQKESAAKDGESNQKAIDKSERATAETIKTNQELTTSKTDALTKSLDEVKLDVSRLIATGVGRVEQRTESRAGISTTAVIVGMIGSVLATTILVVGLIIASRPVPS